MKNEYEKGGGRCMLWIFIGLGLGTAIIAHDLFGDAVAYIIVAVTIGPIVLYTLWALVADSLENRQKGPNEKPLCDSPKYQAAMEVWCKKNMQTGEYRQSPDLFDEILRVRNPHRPRGGVRCIVCGEFHTARTSEGTPKNDVICADCIKQLSAKYKEINHSDDHEIQNLTYVKIIRCMIISFDLVDKAISEECAKKDIAAAETFERIERQNIPRRRENQARMKAEEEKRKADNRKAADETMRRLL